MAHLLLLCLPPTELPLWFSDTAATAMGNFSTQSRGAASAHSHFQHAPLT